MYILTRSDGFKGKRRGKGAAAPLLTGCISKMVKILYKNASFLLKSFEIFLGREQNSLPKSHPLPFRLLIPKFWIRRCYGVYLKQRVNQHLSGPI